MPSAAWFFFWWVRDNQKEPPLVVVQAIIWGIFAALILFPFRYSFTGWSWLSLIIVAAISEEVLKSLAVIYVGERYTQKFDQVIDGIIYAVSVAMGFALLENIVYLMEIWQQSGFGPNFWMTYAVRSLVTTFAHGVFTGIFGFAYAHVYLLPAREDQKQVHHSGWDFLKETAVTIWHTVTLHVIFSHLLSGKKSEMRHCARHLILEGITSAIYVHFIFNLLVQLELWGKDLSFLLPGLMMILGWTLVNKFASKRYKQIIHPHDTPLEKNLGFHYRMIYKK